MYLSAPSSTSGLGSAGGPSNYHIQPPARLSDRRFSRSSSHTSLLGPVFEDTSDETCWRSKRRRQGGFTRSGSGSASGTTSPSPLTSPSNVEEMGEWVLDEDTVKNGKGRWMERERVVLVIGDCPPSALQPLISNPSFANTLIITSISVKEQNSYPSIHQLSTFDLEDLLSEAIHISSQYRKKNKKKSRLTTSPSSSSNPSPFDAILHFLPPAKKFETSMALQRMLREAILITTAITASCTSMSVYTNTKSKSSSSSLNSSDLPISLTHIIPANSPTALPIVIERYLLQLLPSLSPSPSSSAYPSQRPIRPLVLPIQEWMIGPIPLPPYIPSVAPIFFGGMTPIGGSGGRVFLSAWDKVVPPTAYLTLSPASGGISLPDQTNTWEMDRRDSAASSDSSISAEVVTPQAGSWADIRESRSSNGLPPSRLSYVETFEEENEVQGERVEAGGKKKGLFGWMKKRA